MKLFKRQQYERPTGKYQCGRAACWDKPCFNGPKPDGSCGGVTECTPIKKGDHFECCRSAAAGGPCSPGPNPDGTCCNTRPPCVPRLTLRAKRGRITLFACVAVIASILAWFHFGNPHGPMAAVNPGPLSGAHQHLTGIIFAKNSHPGSDGDIHNCSLCHRAHDAGAAGWIAAAFQPSKMSEQCLACHRFGDPNNDKIQNKEHNQVFAHPSKLPDTQCQMCHTEHHGVKASLISITDSQCNTCHQKTVHDFAKDHPAFPENFPLRQFAPVRFDHNKHSSSYFTQGEFKCSLCHVVNSTERNVTLANFEQTCARCHLKDIPVNNLPVLHLDASNPTGSPFNKLLFADGKGADTFFREITRAGNSLQTRLQTASGIADLKTLFRGLKWDAVRDAAKNPNNAATVGEGWLVTNDTDDGLPELRYHATSHADSVMMAWLEFSLKSPSDFQNVLFNSKTGPGSCAKCHVAIPGKPGAIVWQMQPAPAGHTVFSHGTHLKMLDCTGCHAPNSGADLSKQFTANVNLLQPGAKPVSSFNGIKLATCSECHAAKKVAEDCRLCHRYHLEPTLERPGAMAPVIVQSVLAVPSTNVIAADQAPQPDAAAVQKAAADKAAADKLAAEQAAANKAATDKAAAEKAAADKLAAEKATAAKAAADKLAADNLKARAGDEKAKAQAAADKAAADKLAAEKVAADKAAAEKAAAEKLAADKAAADKAAADKAAQAKAAAPAPVAAAARAPRFHGEFIGNQDCVGCHDAEKAVWEASRHNKSWDLRRGGDKVKAILAAVGDKTRATDQVICSSCHFTVVQSTPKFGVSCESCHGAASEWKDIHNTGKGDAAKHTAALEAARQKGMIHSSMKQELIQNCFGCHNYDSGNVAGDLISKMLAAGHPAFAFEFVAFSQGTIRHRFYPPTPDNNAEMTPVELARWYVVGQGAQLVSSTRVLQANGTVDVIKTSQQAKIADATKVLGLIDLPEAKTLLTAPSDDNLTKFIAACDGKDFTGKVGSLVPKEFK